MSCTVEKDDVADEIVIDHGDMSIKIVPKDELKIIDEEIEDKQDAETFPNGKNIKNENNERDDISSSSSASNDDKGTDENSSITSDDENEIIKVTKMFDGPEHRRESSNPKEEPKNQQPIIQPRDHPKGKDRPNNRGKEKRSRRDRPRISLFVRQGSPERSQRVLKKRFSMIWKDDVEEQHSSQRNFEEGEDEKHIFCQSPKQGQILLVVFMILLALLGAGIYYVISTACGPKNENNIILDPTQNHIVSRRYDQCYHGNKIEYLNLDDKKKFQEAIESFINDYSDSNKNITAKCMDVNQVLETNRTRSHDGNVTSDVSLGRHKLTISFKMEFSSLVEVQGTGKKIPNQFEMFMNSANGKDKIKSVLVDFGMEVSNIGNLHTLGVEETGTNSDFFSEMINTRRLIETSYL